MNIIEFDKTRYYQQDAMQKWCEQFIGPGTWSHYAIDYWPDDTTALWIVQSVFGYTTFAFKEEQHLHWFLLKWT